MEQLQAARFPTPLGQVLAVAGERGLCGLYLDEATAESGLTRWRRRFAPTSTIVEVSAEEPALAGLAAALEGYFAGEQRQFDLPLDPRGTDFQREVWAELQRIPFGQTLTYGELARRLARPGGSRAVGAANGANPLPIVIPCHRVVASRGLGGFSAGLERKIRLLRLEGVLLPAADR